MPGTDERRQEVRIPIPSKLLFNVLGSAADFVRGNSLPSLAFDQADTGSELEGRDELERYLKRLDDKLNFIISVLTEHLTKKEYGQKGQLLDLSESGVRLVSPIKLQVGDTLEIGLMLYQQAYRTMDIAGEVIWTGSPPDHSGMDHGVMAGVRFNDILPQDQDEIVHCIFQKQREEIRRSRNME